MGCAVEMLRAMSLLQNTATIDISHLPAGVYYLHISNETAKVVKKIIVNN
jgi:hypothetical protein